MIISESVFKRFISRNNGRTIEYPLVSDNFPGFYPNIIEMEGIGERILYIAIIDDFRRDRCLRFARDDKIFITVAGSKNTETEYLFFLSEYYRVDRLITNRNIPIFFCIPSDIPEIN